MAMKREPLARRRPPTSTRSKKYCLRMLGSSVLPDLLDTMNKVCGEVDLVSMVRICAGSVESSTSSSGCPA